MTKSLMMGCACAAALMGIGASALAQDAWPPKEWPTSYWPAKNWAYPASLDEISAAPENYKLLWQDGKTRLVEVTIAPGETTPVHTNPLPSIFAIDQAQPKPANIADKPAKPGAAQNGLRGAEGGPPPNKSFPLCETAAPEAPHSITNNGSVPIHYFRVEYKRIDGFAARTRWKEWYPWMLQPFTIKKDLDPKADLGKPFSKDFPYPFAYDSVNASPKNHYVRYEDARIRLIDVVGRPGSPENMHGHPYPSVFLNDTTESPEELEAVKSGAQMPSVDRKLYPDDPRNSLWGQRGADLAKVPLACVTMDPQAPHSNTRNADYPRHFMRIEFKRFEKIK